METKADKSFSRLLNLIRTIEEDPKRLESLSECNRGILSEIMKSEAVIAEIRGEHDVLKKALRTSRPTKNEAVNLRVKIDQAIENIDHEKLQIFVWKSFGDAIAHIYLDRFSLKQTFFDVDSYSVKQDAGQLSGKDGLEEELKCLDAAIDAGFPALICDLTHALRYGDICLMDGSDPNLVEVKSGSKLNQRGKRQIERIKRLSSFLETDQAENLRGGDVTTYRAEVPTPERTNVEALNECIAEAEIKGTSVVDPEPGVRIIAIYDGHDDAGDRKYLNAMESFGPCSVFMLNSDKNDRSWAPYAPIILSIRPEKHLLDFYEGNLIIIVLLNLNPLTVSWKSDEWDILETQDNDYAIDCMHTPTRVVSRVGRHLINRAAYEFLSLKWLGEINRPSDGLVEKIQALMRADVSGVGDHEQKLEEMLGSNHPWVNRK